MDGNRATHRTRRPDDLISYMCGAGLVNENLIMSLLYGHNKSSKQLLSACVDDNSQFPLLAVHTTDMAIVMEMMSHLPGPGWDGPRQGDCMSN